VAIRFSVSASELRSFIALGLAVILMPGCSIAPEQEMASSSQQCSQIGPIEDQTSAGEYPTRDGRMLGRIGNQAEREGFIDELSGMRISKTAFREEVRQLLTDEFGPYSVTQINLPSVESLDTKTGRVPEDAKESAVEFLTNFVALHVLDGIFLDNPERLNEWYETVGGDFLDENLLAKQAENDLADYSYMPLLRSIESPYSGLELRLVRDGGPRVVNKKINILGAEDLDLENESALDYGLRASVQFEALAISDASGWWNEHLNFWGPDGNLIVINGVDTPFHTQDAHQLWYQLLEGDIQFDLHYSANEGWKIINYYQVLPNFGSTLKGFQPELLTWRNSLRSCVK